MEASQTDTEGRPFRILSLDGGGSKGVYTLGVLKEVEALCGKPLCEEFQLLYGTSTGAIIAALIGLGQSISAIEAMYFQMIPKIMNHRTKRGRTKALRNHARAIFGDSLFSGFKTHVGIVATNYRLERPMVFKSSQDLGHGSMATFLPGFGCTIADAVVASCSAYPFFERVDVLTQNQGEVPLMDGGYVANNPTLFALADAQIALKQEASRIRVLSIGVGSYNEPKKSVLHRLIFGWWPFRHIAKMFNINSKTIDQLRTVLFPDIHCVRINEAYPQPEYATDLLENDVRKLKVLHSLGRDSFSKSEKAVRGYFQA